MRSIDALVTRSRERRDPLRGRRGALGSKPVQSTFLALLLVTRSLTAGAQGPGVFEVFATRNAARSDPVFGGIAITGFSGIVGVRLSGALHLVNDSGTYDEQRLACSGRGCSTVTDPGRTGSLGVGAWMADADLVIAPFRTLPIAQALLLGFSPYAFVGIGGYGRRGPGSRDTSWGTWSYGAGVQHQLLGWLGVDAEARYRHRLRGDSTAGLGSPRDWTYRVGLTISFGGHGKSASPPPAPTTPSDAVAPGGNSDDEAAGRAAHVLERADELVGTPYRSGGTTPSSGFDDAGFVQYVMAAEGVMLPPSPRRMALVGRPVPTRAGALRPGDLLFFANDGSTVDHVAIYAGRNRIVHASASASAVRYDVLGEGDRGRWFADHLVAARRVLVGRGRGPWTDDGPPWEPPGVPDRAPPPGD